MSRIYRTTMTVFCMAAVVGLFANVAAADFIYDFDANVGQTLDTGALAGQDGWFYDEGQEAAYTIVDGGFAGATGKNVQEGGNAKYAFRTNNDDWGYNLTSNQDFDFSAVVLHANTSRGQSEVSLWSPDIGGAPLQFTVSSFRRPEDLTNGDGGLRFRIQDWAEGHTDVLSYGVDADAGTYRVGIEATALGSGVYSLLGYYQRLDVSGVKTYVNSGNPWTWYCSDLGLFNGLVIRMDSTTRLDDINISQEVPEPSVLALLATGLIGLLAYAWRKR